MKKTKNKLINQLEKSPLFSISLASKELAHSNFWEWLLKIETGKDKKHPFIEVFFEDFYKNGFSFDKVKREEKNRDLTIYFYDQNMIRSCYIIENKIKAIPTKEQLEIYEDEITNVNFKKGLLTGIIETLRLKENRLDNWTFLSYNDISKRIRKINKKYYREQHETSIAETNEYIYQIINNYCDDIDNISEIVSEELIKNKGYYLSDYNELEKIRYNDILLKLSLSFFAEYVVNQIKKDKTLLSEWEKPEVETGFSNKRPVITIVYKDYNDRDNKKLETEKCRIGVQIQGNQFRIYGGANKTESLKVDKEILYYFLVKEGFFEEHEKKGTIRGKASSMTRPCCKYNTDKYIQIYQYWNLPEKVSYDSLFESVREILLEAKEIISRRPLFLNEITKSNN